MDATIATKDDIEGILPLQAQIYRTQKAPENANAILAELIDSNYADVLVVKSNDKVVASGIVFYLKNPGHETPFAFIEGVVVDESVRGQGVGKTITTYAIELAKKNKCYKIIFTSGTDREDAHKFYEKLGFKKWGVEFRMNL